MIKDTENTQKNQRISQTVVVPSRAFRSSTRLLSSESVERILSGDGIIVGIRSGAALAISYLLVIIILVSGYELRDVHRRNSRIKVLYDRPGASRIQTIQCATHVFNIGSILVTDAKEHTLEVRAMATAADGDKSWFLRCEMREKLVEFIQKNYPQCLPRVRAELRDPNTA